ACTKILELDSKKYFDAKVTTANFQTKKISIANIRSELFIEIQKFLFFIQNLIVEKVYAVSKRLQERKKMLILKKPNVLANFLSTICYSAVIFFMNNFVAVLLHMLVEVPPIQQLDVEKNAEKNEVIKFIEDLGRVLEQKLEQNKRIIFCLVIVSYIK
ncbi:13972_t:CDS:2, partial [Cetraspora pellucida]